MFGWTELDYERDKAVRPKRCRDDTADVAARLAKWQDAAGQRGIEYVTFRRLAEILNHSDINELRRTLTSMRPDQHVQTLWSIR